MKTPNCALLGILALLASGPSRAEVACPAVAVLPEIEALGSEGCVLHNVVYKDFRLSGNNDYRNLMFQFLQTESQGFDVHILRLDLFAGSTMLFDTLTLDYTLSIPAGEVFDVLGQAMNGLVFAGTGTATMTTTMTMIPPSFYDVQLSSSLEEPTASASTWYLHFLPTPLDLAMHTVVNVSGPQSTLLTDVSVSTARPIPLPQAAWLFASAAGCLAAVGRRKVGRD